MATTNGVQTQPAKGVVQFTWTITGTNDGVPEAAPQFPLKSVMVTGTFGGGTLLIEESNEGTVWVTSINEQGTAVSLTAAGSAIVKSNAKFHRPRASVSVTSVVIVLTSASAQ